MRKFTVIPSSTFDELQLDAGVLLRTFNPANPVAPSDEDIICATTGGINVVCAASYTDLGEDVDNCPNNMKELKVLDAWDCRLGFTSLGTSAASIRLSLGAADINVSTGAIVPRKDLELTDFSDVWWVGDKANGGLVAVQLKNALSTSGFSLQTTKKGKGQVSVELTGHVSMSEQTVMPMVFYSQDSEETTEWNVNQILSHVTSSYEDATVDDGDSFTATLTAESTYTLADVVVKMGGVDITAMAYDAGVVTIPEATGNITITAMATK